MADSTSRCTLGVALALLCSSLLAACRPHVVLGGDPLASNTSEALAASPAAPFFRNPMLSRVRLSPDGSQLAAVITRAGTEVVIVRPRAGGATRPVTKLERTRLKASYAVNRLEWAGNDRLLVSVERPFSKATGVRARETRLMSVALDGSRPRYLGEDWPYQEYSQFQDQIIALLPDQPEHVLIGLWMPGQSGTGVQRLNVISGALRTVVPARVGSEGWRADHRSVVRVGWGFRSRSGARRFVHARISEDHPWEQILLHEIGGDDEGFSLAGFSARPEQIYVHRTSQHGRNAIYRYDLAARELGPMVFGHPEYDVEGIISARSDGRLLGVRYRGERPVIQWLDPQAKAEAQWLDRALPGVFAEVVSSDQAERYRVIKTSSDVQPPRYYLFDRELRALDPLFSAYPDLEKRSLSRMEPIQYTARDGLVIHGYLTRPLAGTAPYPTIVHPHGGPWARDTWGWDPVVQYLASLGFAVFQPNFRGSDGYGRAFEELGIGEWGLSMQDDITDGTRWLIDQGIADPDRIGIYGASYGGYAALWGLVKTPELFRAGASFAGVTDIAALLSDDANYRGLSAQMERLVGDRWSDRERLIATSPARHAHEIRAPVLIAHGTEDWRVHVKQAEDMADAAEAAGVPVEVHLYHGEGHGFMDERNRIDFYDKLGRFFWRHLVHAAGEVASAEAGQP